ncbi:MAG: PSD1 and planctomycete cytochrome C domain-containing protein [Planctomycetota bacterium]|nr:PSD1 and planctomycete cytochrome C domain-containing protein [Planctomycetota bacterium]
MYLRLVKIAGLIVLSIASIPVDAQTPDVNRDASLRFFENRIRPQLAENCYECHGSERQESGLRLDTYAGILEGGDTGQAVVPGEPDESLLLVALSYENEELEMPPDGRLSDRVIMDMRQWIEMGAPHPDQGRPAAEASPPEQQEERQWSFLPPQAGPLPAVHQADWPQSPLDHHVLSQLERREVAPAPAADRRTLIRRVTFDLIGLPPAPSEVQAFVTATAPDAYARHVDRLLASPRYGERWGRYWLDVARYADSNGLDENLAYGNAWRYRDYVIGAWNADKPFDRFVTEQLAGDLLPPGTESERREHLVATGFLALGPKVLAEVDAKKMEMDIIDEQVDTLGRALLGLTVGCARCHDHKFDPLTNADYYGLAGIFKSTRTMENFIKLARWHENSIATAAQQQRQSLHHEAVESTKAAIKELMASAQEATQQQGGGASPENSSPPSAVATKGSLKQLQEKLAELEKHAPKMPTAMGAQEGVVTDLKIHIRGSHLRLGATVPRRFPTFLAGADQEALGPAQSGRLRLAGWLTDPSHPLTGRVIVNRLWRWHFGRGLVGTPDNFGRLGELPTHPQLLDWLAVRFVEDGWSIKSLHRMILSSATYQLSSQVAAQAARVDPENRLLGRATVRRLEAEAIRDALLFVSSQLDLGMGGSLLHVDNRQFLFDHTSKDGTTYDSRRRSIYLPVIRNHLFDVFQLFDYADASVTNGNRTTSTVAPQALFMLNGDLVRTAMKALASRAVREGGAASRDQIRFLYMATLARQPRPEEIQQAQSFVEKFRVAAAASGANAPGLEIGWEALCQVLLASNEFIHIR